MPLTSTRRPPGTAQDAPDPSLRTFIELVVLLAVFVYVDVRAFIILIQLV